MADELKWFFLIGAGVFVGILVLATVVKLREVARSRHWLAASGKVISSLVESRERGGVHSSDAQRTGSYPKVVYEFRVGGKRFKGSRISLGEPMPDFEVQETLSRYPVGTQVQVYYNPENPKESVLERDLPEGFGKAIGGLAVFVLAAAVLIPLAVTDVAARFAANLGRPESAVPAVLLGAMGLFAALIAYARERRHAEVRPWPGTWGRVEESVIEAYRSRTGSRNRTSILYRPRILFSYEVQGREYRSDRLSLDPPGGSSMAGWLRGLSRKDTPEGPPVEIVPLDRDLPGGGVPTPWVEQTVARYPKGQAVVVYFNPDEPSQALLEKDVRHRWRVPGIALGLLLLSGSILGLV